MDTKRISLEKFYYHIINVNLPEKNNTNVQQDRDPNYELIWLYKMEPRRG